MSLQCFTKAPSGQQWWDIYNQAEIDQEPPLLLSATVSEDGETTVLVFDQAVIVGAGGGAGFTFTATGGPATASYLSGEGTNTLTLDNSRTINQGETLTLAYTQPGDGITGLTGLELASFTGASVTNDSSIPADTAYNLAVLADSPIAFWKLNETSPVGAGSLNDSAGSFDATPNGTIAWNQAGPIMSGASAAGRLNGSTGYITAGASAANALMLAPAWTIELWFYSDFVGASGGRIFSAAADATHRVSIEIFNSNLFTSSSVGGNHSKTSGNLTSTWHYVVLTSTGVLYIDNVAQAGTSSSGLNSTNNLVIGALNNASSFFNGRISNIALYTSVLSAGQVANHWNAAITHTVSSGQTFYWDMEQDTPNAFPMGSDDTPSYDQGATRSTSQAYQGTYSLSVGGGTFRSATFDNQTSQSIWTPLTEGTFRGYFYFTGVPAAWMLFQMTGKDRSGFDDTNDAIKLLFSAAGASLEMNYNGGANTTTVPLVVVPPVSTWTFFEVKFRQTGSPNLSVTIGATTATAVSANVGQFNCDAFHHLLIGNDTTQNPTSLYVDNFQVFGSWQ